MPEKQEVQEWYGRNARVMHSDSDCLIERYECQGKGLIVTYKVFEGMEMVFMEFNSEDAFIPVTPYSEILEITCCRRGRVVCEFANKYVPICRRTISGLAAGSICQLPIISPSVTLMPLLW